ncbi:MAG: ABC transporter ATP-binding protein [Patescibacteria group bacterium]
MVTLPPSTVRQGQGLFDLLRLFYRGYKNYKKNITTLAGLGLLGGIFEAVGVNAVIPLFSFITGGQGKSFDIISQTIEKAFYFLHIPYSFRYLLFLIVLLFIFRAVVLIVSGYLRIKITAEYQEATRNNLFNKFISARWSYLLRQKLGHLETAVMTNTVYTERLLNVFANMVIVFSSLLVYVLVALNISIPITGLTLLSGILLFLCFKPFFRKTHDFSREVEVLNRQAAHHINENIVGMKTIKAMGVEESVSNLAKEYFSELRRFKVKISLLHIIPPSLMQAIGVVFVVGLFSIFYNTPGFNIASLAVIVYLVQRILLYVQQLQGYANFANEAAPYLRETLRFEEESRATAEDRSGSKPFAFEKSLEFKNISFSYTSGKPILKDMSFSIEQGEMVGIIGPSGAGKTTVVDLLLRLFVPDGGVIALDGKDIKDFDLKSWRKHIGYFSQDIFLMNDTIANNIRFHDPSIIDKNIKEAARLAHIADFVETLPEKYETTLGERGVLLSAGQRQRIALARVLARKPEILILDEATSALDNESELKIQEAIDGLKGEITILVIAHRLSTIMRSDRVLTLENGEITGQKSPEEFLKDKNSYFFKAYHIRA